jgi:hypothetical protein
MKLSEMYPAMSSAQRKLIINSLLSSFEYILEVGEDGVCRNIIDDNIDVSVFENVAKRVAEYKRHCQGEQTV